MAIAMVGHNGPTAAASRRRNGFTLLATGNSHEIGASKTLTSPGTISTTISWTTARPGSWIIATFRASGR